MAYYVGGDIDQKELLGTNTRYFYALRRTDEGELYFTRINQLTETATVAINFSGAMEENYNEFAQGLDFFEGRDVHHELVFENLQYEQYRWDDCNLYYFIDDTGNLVVRMYSAYQYPTGI
jgi:hypothetical protein